MNVHFKPVRCYCPDKLEQLEKDYPELKIQSLVNSLNELHFRGTMVSPRPPTPTSEGGEGEGEGSVKVIDDDEAVRMIANQRNLPKLKESESENTHLYFEKNTNNYSLLYFKHLFVCLNIKL